MENAACTCVLGWVTLVASQHQFGGTSAQIDHQIGGLDLAMDDAGGTKEA